MATTKDYSMSWTVSSSGVSWIDGYQAKPADTVKTRVITAKRTKTGQRLPKWKQKIKDHENATTPFNAEWESYASKPGAVDVEAEYVSSMYPTYIYRKQNKGSLSYIGIGAYSAISNVKSTSFCYQLAAAAYQKEIIAARTQMMGMVALGELKETARMLRRPAVGIRKLAREFLDTLKKRKRANPKAWTKNLGEAWLEQAFGWKPFLADAKEAAEAWNRLTQREPEVRHINVGKKYSYDLSATNLSGYDRFGTLCIANNGLTWRCTRGILREKHAVRFRGAVRQQVDATAAKARDLFGFNPEQFLPTAWELLPWSFLADYFVNIGDVLNNLVVNQNDVVYTNVGVTTETRKYGTWVVDLDASRPGGVANWRLSTIKGSQEISHEIARRTFARTPGIAVPMVRLQWSLGLSDGQLGNIAALLSQAKALHPQDGPRNWHR